MTRVHFSLLLLLVCGCAGQQQQLRDPSSAKGYDTAFEHGRAGIALPRVMILIDEQSLGTIATSEVETLAARRLTTMKIPVADQTMLRTTLARNQQMLEMVNDNRAAAALGTQFGADLVLVGEAVAKPSARRISDTNLRTYQAVVTLRAIRTDNALTLATASEHATQVCIEDVSGSAKALRAAAKSALDGLVPEMLENWTVATVNADSFGNPIELSFGGVDQVWKLRAIRDMLTSRHNDLQNVIQRSYSMGYAEFSVDARLPAEKLAEEFVLTPPEGLRMQVLSISTRQLQLRVVEP